MLDRLPRRPAPPPSVAEALDVSVRPAPKSAPPSRPPAIPPPRERSAIQLPLMVGAGTLALAALVLAWRRRA